MSTSSVSNISIQTSMRQTIRQAQMELLKAQQEVSTGQFYDVGAELGSKTSKACGWARWSATIRLRLSACRPRRRR